MLKTVVIGNKVGGVTQTAHFMVMGGDRIVLVDAAGNSPKHIATKIINKDLYIYEEGSSEPSAILNDYTTFQQSVQVSGVDASGTYINYAQTESGIMELGAAPTVAAAAATETAIISSNALWGLAILAGAGGIAAAAGGGGGGGDSTPAPVVTNPLAPTATITMSDTQLNQGQTATVTIVFSEAVSGFSNTDISAPNGTLTTFTSSDSITWTATFTPSTSTTVTANTITLIAGSYTSTSGSVAGNGATSANYIVDTITTATEVTVIVSNDQGGVAANIAGTSILYTFTFSDTVTGFTAGDITVAHGTPGVFTQVSGSVYTLAVTPTAGYEGNVTVDVAAGVAQNIAGTLNSAAYTSNQAADMLAPTITSVTLADPALTIGETTAVTVVFSEAVKNFSNATLDLSGAQGTLSTLTSSDNITWTGLFTPSALTSDASNKIQVLNTYTDMAGNAGTLGVSANFTIDTRSSPTASPTFTFTDDGVSTTDGITHTNGLTVSGITAGNTWEYSLNGGSSWTNGTGTTFNLVENLQYNPGQIEVRQTDSLGNVSSIVTNAQAITVDTILPTVTIVDDEPMVTANMDGKNTDGSIQANGGDILYTFTFSEAIKNFSIDDIMVTMQKTDGTVDAAYTAASDTNGLVFKTFAKVSDTVYTLSVHPQAGYEGDMKVSILPTAATDTAGNNIDNTNPSDLGSIQAVDMRAPFPSPLLHGSLTVSAYDVTHQRLILNFDETLEQVNHTALDSTGAPFGVMINGQSVIVKAVGVSDNSVGMADNQVFLYLDPVLNARGENFDWINAGITVSYTHTPGDLTTVIQDLAGNDATSFNDYVVDTLAPDATITMADTFLSSGETSKVTFAFSEAVNFSNSDLDLTLANGTMSTLSSADGGKTWTGDFTPTINTTSSSSIIGLNNTYTDMSGNQGIANGVNYAIDTQAPIINMGATTVTQLTHEMTFTFNEALDAVNFAPVGMFTATDGVTQVVGDPNHSLVHFAIQSVSINGNTATVMIDPSILSTAGTTWTLSYTDAPGNDTQALQDLYGSDVSSFTYSYTVI
ncbi:MAG: Ig-like domain-containing protein [Sulfuricurvum sp.]|nr:Ig-like domain-containing protein [Sulfuricurvum sp.]